MEELHGSRWSVFGSFAIIAEDHVPFSWVHEIPYVYAVQEKRGDEASLKVVYSYYPQKLCFLSLIYTAWAQSLTITALYEIACVPDTWWYMIDRCYLICKWRKCTGKSSSTPWSSKTFQDYILKGHENALGNLESTIQLFDIPIQPIITTWRSGYLQNGLHPHAMWKLLVGAACRVVGPWGTQKDLHSIRGTEFRKKWEALWKLPVFFMRTYHSMKPENDQNRNCRLLNCCDLK